MEKKTTEYRSLADMRYTSTDQIISWLQEGKTEKEIVTLVNNAREALSEDIDKSDNEKANEFNRYLRDVMIERDVKFNHYVASLNGLTVDDIEEICRLSYYSVKLRLFNRYLLQEAMAKSDIILYDDGRVNIIAPMFSLTGFTDSEFTTMAVTRILRAWLSAGKPDDISFWKTASIITFNDSDTFEEPTKKETFDEREDIYTIIYYDSELKAFMGRINIPATHRLAEMIHSGFAHPFVFGIGVEGAGNHFSAEGQFLGIERIFINLIQTEYKFHIDGSRFIEDGIIPRPKGMTVCYPFEAKEIKVVLEVKDMVNYAAQLFAADKVPVVFLREDGIKTKVGEIEPKKVSASQDSDLLFSTNVKHMIPEYPYYQIELERVVLDEDEELVAVIQQGFNEL